MPDSAVSRSICLLNDVIFYMYVKKWHQSGDRLNGRQPNQAFQSQVRFHPKCPIRSLVIQYAHTHTDTLSLSHTHTHTQTYQVIQKGEVSLYHWTPLWLVWNQLYDKWQYLFLFATWTTPNQSNTRSRVQWYFPPLVFPAYIYIFIYLFIYFYLQL